MTEPLFELLRPHFHQDDPGTFKPSLEDVATPKYLTRLSTLQLESLRTTEPQSLAQSSHSTSLSIQALSSRSSKSLINSSEQLKTLEDALPSLALDAKDLDDGITTLDQNTIEFSNKYSRTGENELLERRKKALLMSRNVDRIGDVLDLPTLLRSAISSATAQGSAGNANYATALDLHSHIKRLHLLYPDSVLLRTIYSQAEEAMKDMATNLIATLKSQNIKLAGGMRTIGWLRRIAPQLGSSSTSGRSISEGCFGAVFLVCRLSNLVTMLDALEPLRHLADQETQKRAAEAGPKAANNAWAGGQQTERYLKRYIEIFREQSFGIISMFRSIFPGDEAAAKDDFNLELGSLGLRSSLHDQLNVKAKDHEVSLPTALTTFPSHLVYLLTETLRTYLPNVRDKSSRESLLTQILYCAGSLGRLGGDFSLILASLAVDQAGDGSDSGEEVPEWVAAMQKHKSLAGKLESFASSTGSGKGKKTHDAGDRRRSIKA